MKNTDKRVSRSVNSYSKQTILDIVRNVCNQYKTGEYTIESCCKNAGVPYRTYKDWWARYKANQDNEASKWYCLAEVAGLWEQTQEEHRKIRDEVLVKKAETALEKRISGYEYEVTIITVKKQIASDGTEILMPTGYKKIKKLIPPSVAAIKFVLTKLKPEVYSQREIVMDITSGLPPHDVRTLEEIVAEIEELNSNICS